MSNRSWNFLAAAFMAMCLIFGSSVVRVAQADTAPRALPMHIDWSDTSLIDVANDWSGVPGVVGYLGENLGSKVAGVNPQNILVDGTDTTLMITPNLSKPDSLSSAGVVEFEINDPTVALSGSNAPHAPFLLINLDTRGYTDISVSYDVRDLESTKQNAVQQVALHYRTGSSGSFTNLPAGYVADATEPYTASKVTHVSALLPHAAENQALVQLRIMTANAVGRDEWVGIDNIIIDGVQMPDDAPAVIDMTPVDGAVAVPFDSNLTVTFSEPVSLSEGWFSLTCTRSGLHAVTAGGDDGKAYTLDPLVNFARNETCTALIPAEFVSDHDGLGPEHPAADFSWVFTSGSTGLNPVMEIVDWEDRAFTGRQQDFLLTLSSASANPTIPRSRLQFTLSGAKTGDIAELAVFDPVRQTWEELPLTQGTEGLTAVWGPVDGFSVPGSFASVKLCHVRFAQPGSYTMTIDWLDLDELSAGPLAKITRQVDVRLQMFLPVIWR